MFGTAIQGGWREEEEVEKGWKGRWRNGGMDKCVGVWRDGYVDRSVHEWRDGWISKVSHEKHKYMTLQLLAILLNI